MGRHRFVVALLATLAFLAPLAPHGPVGAARGELTERGDVVRILVRPTDRVGVAAAAATFGGRAAERVAQLGVEVLEVPAAEAPGLLTTLRRSGTVRWAELDATVRIADTTPDDPYWSQQWGPAKVRAPRAWDTTVGSASVVVAVLDTGVNAHPDLAGAMVAGIDVVDGDSVPEDDHGHGTAVAGIVAARTDNGQGVAGHCWTCSIMPVRVLGTDGSGTASSVANGLVWAADNGADVVNLSLTSTSRMSMVDDAVTYARSRGVVVIAAAGNSGSSATTYPAGSPGAVGVAASDALDQRYSFSNYGSWVDLAAPGCHLTTNATGGYYTTTSPFCGTSAAAPAVAGTVGLLRAARPDLGEPEIVAALTESATPVGTWVAYGRIDAAAGVAAASALPVDSPSDGSGSTGDGSQTGGGDSTTTAPADAPGAPGSVAASAGDEQATVSWSAPDDAGSTAITGYRVVVSPGGRSIEVGPEATSTIVGDLTNGTAYTFSVAAANDAGWGPASASEPVTPAIDELDRVAGAGRIATAVSVSQRVFSSAPAVVLARADQYADALAASSLAGKRGAPVLLTQSDSLDPAVRAEIDRLGPSTVYLAGGPTAVSDAVAAALEAEGYSVVRFAGANRFDTAARIAQEVGGDQAYVVAGAHPDPNRGWPDAVAVSGLAALQGRPILLTRADAAPDETLDTLELLSTTRVTVVGGTAAVSDQVAAALADPDGDGSAQVQVDRLSGSSRYATSVAVADAATGGGADGRRVWVATGRGWADALAAGAAVAARGGVLLLVDGRDAAGSQVSHDWLGARGGTAVEGVAVGGTGVVTDEVLAALNARL